MVLKPKLENEIATWVADNNQRETLIARSTVCYARCIRYDRRSHILTSSLVSVASGKFVVISETHKQIRSMIFQLRIPP